MTHDQAQSLLRYAITQSVVELQKTGNCNSLVRLIFANGDEQTILMGEKANDESWKRRTGEQLRARISQGDVAAYLIVSDMYRAHVAHNDILAVRKYKLARALGLNLKDAADLGLVEIVECVLAMVELPDGYICQMMQEYLRDPANPSVTHFLDPQGPEEAEGATGYLMGMWRKDRQFDEEITFKGTQ